MTPKREEKYMRVARAREKGLLVVLEDIHDPHNAEAVMRTCDAFGVQDVWLIFERQKPFNPRRVGKASSSSANKWLSFRTFPSAQECLAELHGQGYFVAATALGGQAHDLYRAELPLEKLALVFGNEHTGISDTMRAGADALITIPLRGFVESLNLSVAAALCVAEVVRRRREKNIRPRLSDLEIQGLFNDFKRR